MRRIAHFGLLVAMIGFVGWTESRVSGQGPPRGRGTYLARIYIDPASLSFEIDYDGSLHQGHGALFRAFAVYRTNFPDGSYTETQEEISDRVSWSSSDPEIYLIVPFDGDIGNVDSAGLWVFWWFNPTQQTGTTTITAWYGGLWDEASLTATDGRP